MLNRDKILPVWKQYKQALELITCLAAYSIVRLNENNNLIIKSKLYPHYKNIFALNLMKKKRHIFITAHGFLISQQTVYTIKIESKSFLKLLKQTLKSKFNFFETMNIKLKKI